MKAITVGIHIVESANKAGNQGTYICSFIME